MWEFLRALDGKAGGLCGGWERAGRPGWDPPSDNLYLPGCTARIPFASTSESWRESSLKRTCLTCPGARWKRCETFQLEMRG